MTKHRQVTIYMNAEEQHLMQQATSEAEWFKALGYFATWNTAAYPKCDIYADGYLDMVAVYYNERGDCAYAVGAIWRGTHYDFR